MQKMKKTSFLVLLMFVIFTGNVFAMTCSKNNEIVPCSEMPPWFLFLAALELIISLVFGILFLYRPYLFAKWIINLQNKLLGMKRDIKPILIVWLRITGIILIIISIFALISLFNILRLL